MYILFYNQISKSFLDNTTLCLSLLAILVSFLARPLGAITFAMCFKNNYLKSIKLSSLVMILSTCIIGLLPSYKYIGYISLFVLFFMRIFQGISMGSQYTTLIFLAKKYYSDKSIIFPIFGAVLGLIVASIFFILNKYFDLSWRIFFIIPIILLPLVLIQKSNITSLKNTNYNGIKKEILKIVVIKFILNFLVCVGIANTVYLLFSFIPIIMIHKFGTLYSIVNLVFISSFALGILCCKLKKSVFGIVLILSIIFAILTRNYIFGENYLVQFLIIFSTVLLASQYYSYLIKESSNIFTGKYAILYFSISYNLSLGIVGGLSPIIYLKLFSIQKSLVMIYFAISLLISLITIYLISVFKNYGYFNNRWQ